MKLEFDTMGKIRVLGQIDVMSIYRFRCFFQKNMQSIAYHGGV